MIPTPQRTVATTKRMAASATPEWIPLPNKMQLAAMHRTIEIGFALLLAACGGATTACAKSAGASSDAGPAASAHVDEKSPELDALWAAAASGEADDLARLADREGAAALAEAGADPNKKLTAIRALAFADGFAGLPFLAQAADGADAEQSRAAVDAIDALAGAPRRAVDPEDAVELRAGCNQLLVIAKNSAKPRPVRVGIVRALRMWADRACAKAEEIPLDVDTK